MGNQASGVSDGEKVGYRILGVQDQSPAASCGLVPYFDFIVAANGTSLNTLDSTFVDIIQVHKLGVLFPLSQIFQAHENKQLNLTIYNYKTDTLRNIIVTPSRSSWSGDGLLGVTIRFDSYAHAEEYVCRVCEVIEESPADLAGLQANEDYILGSAEKVYPDMESMYKDLQENIDKPMEWFVYNSKTDSVRIVVVMPTLDWNGDGLLGATIGYGYLHHLPRASKLLVTSSETINDDSSTTGPSSKQQHKLKVTQSAFGSHERIESVASPLSKAEGGD